MRGSNKTTGDRQFKKMGGITLETHSSILIEKESVNKNTSFEVYRVR